MSPLPPPPAWPPEDEAIREAVLQAMRDGSWGQYEGPHGQQLAAALAARFDVEHVMLCSSGTFAVELALRALRIEGGEVVLAGYDFAGNFRAIEAVGARPVLADLAGDTLTLSADTIMEALSRETRAVVVSHLHGGLAPMQAITQLARQRGLLVVEDACQAPGAVVDGRPAGSWGDAATLSFGGSKLLTAGRGGALLTSQAAVHQRAKVYCERGNHAYPLSELQAAALLPQLATLDERNARRTAAARWLEQYWQTHDGPRVVLPGRETLAIFKLPWLQDDASQREAALQRWRAAGAPVGEGFRGFLRRSAARCRRAGSLARAEAACQRTVLLDQRALLGDERYLLALAERLADWRLPPEADG